MVIQQDKMKAADVRELEDQPGNERKRFELIDGEIYEMAAAKPIHAHLGGKFFRFMDEFVEDGDLGYVFGDSCTYHLSDEDEFIPDASFVSKARLPETWQTHEFTIAPDIAVEVVSPSNTVQEIDTKIAKYLFYGTRLIWIAYYKTKTIHAYHATGSAKADFEVLDLQGILNGFDVLPGFALPVSRIFPK